MNYFEFYQLPLRFAIDKEILRQKYFEISKQFHPDFHANSDDEKQQEILELSTLNNKAYQTLSDPNKVLEYVLKLHELVSEGAKPSLPADFLMEMMDINERLMEIDNAEQFGEIGAEVAAIEGDMTEELNSLTNDYETLNDTAKEDRLNHIANIYYRQKYLLRIKESLDTFAARF